MASERSSTRFLSDFSSERLQAMKRRRGQATKVACDPGGELRKRGVTRVSRRTPRPTLPLPELVSVQLPKVGVWTPRRMLPSAVRAGTTWGLAPRPTAPGAESANLLATRLVDRLARRVALGVGVVRAASAISGAERRVSERRRGRERPQHAQVANATALRFLILSLQQRRVDEARRRSRDATPGSHTKRGWC
jgi:hypothetical protein